MPVIPYAQILLRRSHVGATRGGLLYVSPYYSCFRDIPSNVIEDVTRFVVPRNAIFDELIDLASVAPRTAIDPSDADAIGHCCEEIAGKNRAVLLRVDGASVESPTLVKEALNERIAAVAIGEEDLV